MTKLSWQKTAAIAACCLGGGLAFSCLAGAAQDDFSHVVRIGKSQLLNGDRITILEVRGPSDKWTAGNTYEVRGTYKLASLEKATLAAYVTTPASQPEVPHALSAEQTTTVSKGEGQFTLRFHMWHAGDPHVSFYPAGGGNSLFGVYF
jgi:hypothetical protein